ncbi:MAG: hypothetical protein ACXVAS_19055 [Vulcanimicrobiaceae bacterium]
MCAWLAGASHAELLQRLHVLGFTVTSDTPRPRVNVPFHVTLTVHVREHITQLQYVSLPTFSGFENLSDRRSLTHVHGDGSIYRETLTLVAHNPGPIAIGSAYLDAVDLRDGKTKRFISNDLILNVSGTALQRSRATVRAILLAILALLLLAAAIFALVIIFRRRRAVAVNGDPAPLSVGPSQAAPSIGLDEALANLRKWRDRSSVLRVREALWSIVGASQGETLGDVLQGELVRSDGLRRVLIAIEHAAFVHDTHLQQAIEKALSEEGHRIAQ